MDSIELLKQLFTGGNAVDKYNENREKENQSIDPSMLPWGGKTDAQVAEDLKKPENQGPVAMIGHNPNLDQPQQEPSLFARISQKMQEKAANGDVGETPARTLAGTNKSANPMSSASEVPKTNPVTPEQTPVQQAGVYGKGLEDSDLEAAQKQANFNRMIGMFANASSRIGSALSKGAVQAEKVGQGAIDNADNGVKQILQRRDAKDKDTAKQLNDIKLKQEKDDVDPTSARSKAFRKALEDLNPKLKQIYGKDWDLVTAADKDRIMDPIKLKEQIEMRKEVAEQNRLAKAQLNNDKKSEKEQKAYTEARQHLESFRGNSEATQAAKNVLAGKNALSLVEGKNPNSLSVSDLRLLYEEMGKIASGGVPGEHGVQQMMPETARSKLAQIGQFLTNKPSDAQAGEFIKRNIHYLKDIYNNAQNVIDNYRSNILKGYKGRFSDDKYNEILNDYPGVKTIQTPKKDGNIPSDMVKVISPDGQIGMIPRANLEKAKARGFKESQ